MKATLPIAPATEPDQGSASDDLFEGFPRLDKTKISKIPFDQQDDTLEYWLSRTPEERFQQIEFLRRIAYGDKATARLQRVYRIIKLDEM